MAKAGSASDRKPEDLIDRALDHLGAGTAAPEGTRTGQSELGVWAAEVLAAFGDALPVADSAVDRDRILREARELWGRKPQKKSSGLWWRAALWSALFVVILTSTFVWRAQSSLPGDRLWEVKRWTEGVRQWVARGDTAKAQRALANTRERLQEANQLIDRGHPEYARAAIFEFYREFQEVQWRLRGLSREREPDLFDEADRQSAEAVDIENKLTGGEAQKSKPVTPVVGTRSPTPRPPWLPGVPEETPTR